MKKIILSIFALSFLSAVSIAQISLMPKFGIAFTDVKFKESPYEVVSEGTETAEVKARLGLMGGLAVNIGVSELFSVQPELMYIQKGFKLETPNLPFKGDVRIDYLEIPILAKFSVGDENKRGYFNLGPQVSFGLGGKTKIESFSEERKGKVKFEEEPEFSNDEDFYFDNGFDFGIQAGGGFGVKAGPGLLTIDFRYSLGFGNLFDTPSGADKDDFKSKNRMFATNIAYVIPLGQ
jgi:hypothetical protein